MPLLLNGNPFFPGASVIEKGLFFDGSAAAPSIAIASQPDLGFFKSSSSTIGFSSGGVGSLFFAGNGAIFGANGSSYISLPNSGLLNFVASGTNQHIFLQPSGTAYVQIGGSNPGVISITGQDLRLGTLDTGTAFTVKNSSLNVLFGTATDSNNGKIQLANHTAIAGGIGFGTGASIYATTNGGATLETNSSFRSNASTGGIGYSAGAGGTVVQGAGSGKGTAFTLSKVCGLITMDGANLAANTTVSCTWTNTVLAVGDAIVFMHDSVGTLGAYSIGATVAAGSATLFVRNLTAGALAEAIKIRFAVIKAVTA